MRRLIARRSTTSGGTKSLKLKALPLLANVKLKSSAQTRRLLPKRFLNLGQRRFDISAIGRFAAAPFADHADCFVLMRCFTQNFRDAKRCRHRGRSLAMKNKHDLRCARFAGIQRDRSDFIEVTSTVKRLRANRGRLRPFRFSTTGDDKHDC